jgi:hypothetical protein
MFRSSFITDVLFGLSYGSDAKMLYDFPTLACSSRAAAELVADDRSNCGPPRTRTGENGANAQIEVPRAAHDTAPPAENERQA